MKKISLKFFRNYLSNIIIFACFGLLLSITYLGGVVQVFSSTNGTAIYNGDRQKNNITLMINVYWGNEYLPEMISILNQNNVKATFFVGGSWVNGNSEYFDMIYNSGNEIGNHGYWHKDHDKITYSQQINEITMTDELVYNLCGYKMNLFAPPSGAYNKQTLEIAESLGYKTIMWSKDTIDWRDKNTELIYKRATQNPTNGDLILMHPTQNTVDALDDIIKFYMNNNFNLVTVSENIAF